MTTDPTNHGSYTANVKQIQKHVQKIIPGVSLKEIESFRFSKPQIQITKNKIKKFKRVPIFSPGPNHCWSADSAFLPELKKHNDNEPCIIFFVDVFSRYAYARTCKTPSAKAVVTALTSIFQEAKPKSLFTDLGE